MKIVMKSKLIMMMLASIMLLKLTDCNVKNSDDQIDQGTNPKAEKHINEDFFIVEKPVIYIYDNKNHADAGIEYDEEKATRINLDLTTGSIKCTYPKIDSDTNSWNVTAFDDGSLIDADGHKYDYLFWDGEMTDVSKIDVDKGFSVKGSDTASFLEEKLELLGLNDSERNDFITYWLPRMEMNPYNTICFQTEAYTDWAKLNVNPAPDSVIRVFMAWYPTDEKEAIKEQTLITPERGNFTVVEWGGIEVRAGSFSQVPG